MDYRKFLGKEEEWVLPYLGGPSVRALDRTLRLAEPPTASGWYRFGVKGRVATVKGPAEPGDLSALPVVRGHFLGGRLVRDGAVAEPLELLPEETPAPLSPLKARRWPSGELLFEQLEFEGDAEEPARRALEEGRTLAEVKGAPATLRAAFGYAVFESTSRRVGVPASPAEVRAHVGAAAERGAAAAEAVLSQLREERLRYERALRELQARLEREARDARDRAEAERLAQAAMEARQQRLQGRRGKGSRDPEADAISRAFEACEAAGAQPRSARSLGHGRLEVIYGFMGERFISVVDAVTLQVLDAGICLDGEDERVTLDSLFSVIREAIETEQLVITRHV